MVYTPTEISVRRIFTLLKQSQYVVPVSISSSRRSVSMIIARVGLTSTVGEARRLKASSASSSRPFRTSHHGDSGAKGSPARMIKGQSHWTAKGAEYAQWVDNCEVPAITPLANSCPITKQRLIYEVRTPRRAMGQTSEAYVGAIVAYVPKMRPPRSSPASSTGRERAKNWMKIHPAVPMTQAPNA